jgi:hypothetical protein
VPLYLRFWIFFSWRYSSFLQKGVCWKCYPFQDSCCGADYLLFPLSEGTGIPTLWWGMGSLLYLQWRVLTLCTVGGRSPSMCRIVDSHSVEELRFQLLDRRDGSLWRGGTVWSGGLLCTLEKQAFSCHLQSSRSQLSSIQWRIWCFCSLTREQGPSHYQGQ